MVNTKSSRFGTLKIVRALAALAVVVFHAGKVAAA
jgi:peptidoglycan/LPS O-acetylase OafA/YrhL